MIFDNKDEDMPTMVARVLALHRSILHVYGDPDVGEHPVRLPRQVQWQCKDDSMVVLNVDGSALANPLGLLALEG